VVETSSTVTPFWVLHPGDPGSAGRRDARIDGRIVAVEVAEPLQIVHLAGGVDRRCSHITYGESLDGDRVLLALIPQSTASPVHVDGGSYRSTA